MRHSILVSPDGTCRAIYNDALLPVMPEDAKVARVSHVEPSGKLWEADMAPFGPKGQGVVLGPFQTRAEALAAEVRWLMGHM